MLKRIVAALLIVTVSMITAVSANTTSGRVLYEYFDNYTNESGYVLPSGWGYYANSLVPTEENHSTYSVSSASFNGNKYLKLSKTDTSKNLRVGYDFTENNIGSLGTDYTLHFKIMTTANVESTFVILTYGSKEILPINFKADYNFSPIGGSSSRNDAAIAAGGTAKKYDIGTWYNIDIVSKTVGASVMMSTYIDGVMRDSMDVTSNSTEGLTRVAFNVSSPSQADFGVDDVEVYTSFGSFVVQTGNPAIGGTNVPCNGPLTYVFSNRADPRTVSNIKLYDASNNAIGATVSLGSDMKTVTVTPAAALNKNSVYHFDLTGFTDLTGNAYTGSTISFTTSRENKIFDEHFEDYTNATGYVQPSGWGYYGGSLVPTSPDTANTIKSASDSDGKYVELYKESTSKLFRIGKNFTSIGNNYMLHFKIKLSKYAENNTVLLSIGSDTTPMNFKANAEFSLIGGTSTRTGAIIKKITYNTDTWYNIDVVSKTSGSNVIMTTYVDGVMKDTMDITSSATTGLTRVSFNLATSLAATMGIDDVSLYTAYSETGIVSGSIANGQKGVNTKNDITYTFANRIDPSTLSSIALTSGGANTSVTASLSKDMKTVTISPDSDLAVSKDYVLSFLGVKDISGYDVKANDIAFKTQSDFIITSAIDSYTLDSGILQATVNFNNEIDSNVSSTVFAALYNENNNLIDVNSQEILMTPYGTDSINVSLGNGNAAGGCIMKIFVLENLENIRPMGEVSKITVDKYIGAKLAFPSDFATIPFDIYRNGSRKYSTTATPETVFDTTQAVEIFVSNQGKSSSTDDSSIYLGLERSVPITPTSFKVNVLANRYNTDSYILTLTDAQASSLNLGLSELPGIKNILIRSGNASGITWVGNLSAASWVKYAEGDLYTTDLSSNPTGTVMYPLNLKNVNEYGMPQAYAPVADLAACLLTKGSFVRVDNTLYVNPFESENMSNLQYLWLNGRAIFTDYGDKKVVFDGLGFFGGCYNLRLNSVNSELYVFNSKFFRGTSDAFGISGAYKVYVINCVAAYSTKDGFNYHASDNNSLAVEINCVAYGSGKYKIAANDAVSNNGSTAHNSIKMLRVGGKYWDCEGPIVADTNNCYSITIGCEAKTVLNTTTGIRSAFWYSDVSEPSTDKGYIQKKYFIDCLSGGENLDYGYYGPANNEVYALDNQGFMQSNCTFGEITWDDIISGNWK